MEIETGCVNEGGISGEVVILNGSTAAIGYVRAATEINNVILDDCVGGSRSDTDAAIGVGINGVVIDSNRSSSEVRFNPSRSDPAHSTIAVDNIVIGEIPGTVGDLDSERRVIVQPVISQDVVIHAATTVVELNAVRKTSACVLIVNGA